MLVALPQCASQKLMEDVIVTAFLYFCTNHGILLVNITASVHITP